MMAEQIEEAMEKIYGASHCSLHVRMSNKPAIALYKDLKWQALRKTTVSIFGSNLLYIFMNIYQIVMVKMPCQ